MIRQVNSLAYGMGYFTQLVYVDPVVPVTFQPSFLLVGDKHEQTHTHRDTGMQNYSENCPTISSKLSEMRQGHVFDAKIEPSLGLMDLGLQESSQTSQTG